MRSILSRGMMAATFALAGACSSADGVAPTAPAASASLTAAPGVTAVRRAIDQNVWVSCANSGAGEAVRVAGELRYDVQRVTDASGVLHLNIKSNTSNLTAVGLTTGTVFHGLMTERINSRATDDLNMDVRTADVIRFVARATGDAYALLASSHFVVDDGSYVLWDQTWNEVCR